jgi:hypothetical protein
MNNCRTSKTARWPLVIGCLGRNLMLSIYQLRPTKNGSIHFMSICFRKSDFSIDFLGYYITFAAFRQLACINMMLGSHMLILLTFLFESLITPCNGTAKRFFPSMNSNMIFQCVSRLTSSFTMRTFKLSFANTIEIFSL